MRENVVWTLAEVLEATGGERFSGNPDVVFSGISIDSRTAMSSDLFVAIVGKRHDGHEFLRQVINTGVRGILIDRRHAKQFSYARLAKLGLGCVVVPDTTIALGDMANFYKKRFGVLLVAVTGTNGKTTTKEMTGAVLSGVHHTLKSGGNHNNEIGLPFSLFGLNSSHDWAVVELGMNHPGEIARLTKICEPEIGVITNVGPGHLEGVGSLQGVLAAKKELLDNMGEKTAVLNLDDKRVAGLAKGFGGKIVFYGKNPKAVVRAKKVRQTKEGVHFILCLPDIEIPVHLRLHGVCMVENALAAAAVGVCAGVPPSKIRSALQKMKPVSGRQNIVELGNKAHVIDDTYNANPASFKSALSTLKNLAKIGKGRAVLVASDMAELGAHSVDAHINMGSLAAVAGVSRLYATGYFAGWTLKGAREAGMDASQTVIDEKNAIILGLGRYLKPKDWILVKGSRTSAMEEIVTGLKEAFPIKYK